MISKWGSKGIYLLFAAVFLCANSGYSQEENQQIAEVQNLLAHAKNDKTRLKLLLDLGTLLRDSDPQKCLPYSQEALALSKSLKDNQSRMEALNDLGIANANLSKHSAALNYYKKANEIAVNNKDLKSQGLFSNNIGNVYLATDQYELAVQHFTKSLRIKKKLNDKKGIGLTYSNLGIVSYYRGQLEQAKDYFLKSLTIRKELKDEQGIAHTTSNIGSILIEQEKYVEGIRYLNVGLHYDDSVGNFRGVAESYLEIGGAYFKLKDYKKALEHQKKAIPLFEEFGGPLDLSSAYNSIAATYSAISNSEESLRYYHLSLEKAKEAGSLRNMATSYKNLSLEMENLGDYKKALSFQKKYISTSEKILSLNNAEVIEEMQTKFETQEKIKENKLLKNDVEIKSLQVEQSWTLIYAFGSFSLFLITGGGLLFYRNKVKRKVDKITRSREDAIVKQQLTELELQALRSQINPHFIFNCLSSIQNMVDKGDNDLADQYLGKFARLMRLTLEGSREESTVLEKEIDCLRLYLDLESMRFANTFSYHIYSEPDINESITMIPSMLIQPFVENAIIHGISGLNRPGEIQISFAQSDNILKCTIEDNGVGRLHAEKRKKGRKSHKSLGLKISEERLKLRGNHGGFKVIDLYDEKAEPNGTRVEIHIPIE